MGYGTKIDRFVGTMSRALHLRSAKHNTTGDLGPYLDLSAEQMFPDPPPIDNIQVKRTLVDRAMKTSTLKWKSSHEVLCPHYRKRHLGVYKRNLTAWARWVRPDGPPRRRCIIYVHGWLEPGSWVEETTLFQKWTRELGVDMVHVSLPFHGRRNPRGALFSGEFFWTADMVRSLEGVRQAICDVRAMMAWLKTQGYDEVGVSGISLGGALTMVLACLEPLPDFAIPIVGHLELQDAVEKAPIMWRMKYDLEKWGVDKQQRSEIFGRLGISSYLPKLDTSRQLWVEAREDVYINADLVEKQRKAWGEPEIHWIEGGHMTFPLHVDAFTKRIGEFLEGLG